MTALEDTRCRAPVGAGIGRNLTDDFEITVTPSQPRVKQNRSVQLNVVIRNKTSSEAIATFDIGCMTEPEAAAYNAAGDRADLISEPMAMLCASVPMVFKVPKGGELRTTIPFQAKRYREDETGNSRVVGPLAPGTYKIEVTLPTWNGTSSTKAETSLVVER